MSDYDGITVECDRMEFVAYLRRLADALESADAATFDVEEEKISIPQGALFWVAHEREDGEVELELQVTWSLLEDTEEEGSETDDDGNESKGDAAA